MRIALPLVAAFAVVTLAAPAAQERLPSVRLVPAPALVMPGAVDSNIPLAWSLTEGRWELSALASWGGIPALLTGSSLDTMQRVGAVTIAPHPGHGVWIESVIPDDQGTWYGYYHHEAPAEACGRLDRFIPRIGAARSTDRGATWEDLGIILEGPLSGTACTSTNRFVLGGVGDVSAILSADRSDLFLYFTQYPRSASAQGIAVARLAWADRDAPAGRLTLWNQGAWLPDAEGTPLVAPVHPWHDGNAASDAFWGPSIHWNAYLDRYVMLINRARDESFNNEEIYVSFASRLDDPRGWSAPRKFMNGGGWYPQVAGLDTGSGTDKEAGQRARFFLTGRSEHYLEFTR